MMIKHMFVFGVILPTLITIIFFVAFLVCWFKFNIRERVMKSQFFMKHFTKEGVNTDAVMHNSVVYSRESYYQDHQWDDTQDSTHKDVQLEPRGNPGQLLRSEYKMDDQSSVCSYDESQKAMRNYKDKNPPFSTDAQTTSVGPMSNSNCKSFATTDNSATSRRCEHMQQTFRFPTLNNNFIKHPKITKHIKGIKDNADYEHFVPLDNVNNMETSNTTNRNSVASPNGNIAGGNNEASFWTDRLCIDTIPANINLTCAASIKSYAKPNANSVLQTDRSPAIIQGV